MLLAFLFLAIATMPYNNEFVKRLTLNAFIYINVLIFVASLYLSKKNKDYYSLKLILLVFMTLVFSILIFNSVNVNTIAIGLGYLSSFLIVYYSEYINFTRNTLKVFTWVSVLSAVVFIYYYYSPIAYRYVVDNEYGLNEITHYSLTLGYPNPNTTASIIAPISMILVILSKIHTKRYFKYGLFVLSLVLLYFLYLTGSRSAFISVFLFHSLVALKIKIKINKMLVISVLSSLFIFVFFYTFLYLSHIGLDWEIMGKPFFSGRQEFLSNMFYETFDSWLIGDISKYKYGNLLNGFLSVFASGGIVNVIFYVLFFSHNIAKRYDRNNDYSYTALLAIVLFYLQGFAEGNFMVTGAYFSVLMSMLYVLTNVKVVNGKRT